MYIKREPWITSRLLVSSINKDKLLRRQFHKPNVERTKKNSVVFWRVYRAQEVHWSAVDPHLGEDFCFHTPHVVTAFATTHRLDCDFFGNPQRSARAVPQQYTWNITTNCYRKIHHNTQQTKQRTHNSNEFDELVIFTK